MLWGAPASLAITPNNNKPTGVIQHHPERERERVGGRKKTAKQEEDTCCVVALCPKRCAQTAASKRSSL